MFIVTQYVVNWWHGGVVNSRLTARAWWVRTCRLTGACTFLHVLPAPTWVYFHSSRHTDHINRLIYMAQVKRSPGRISPWLLVDLCSCVWSLFWSSGSILANRFIFEVHLLWINHYQKVWLHGCISDPLKLGRHHDDATCWVKIHGRQKRSSTRLGYTGMSAPSKRRSCPWIEHNSIFRPDAFVSRLLTLF